MLIQEWVNTAIQLVIVLCIAAVAWGFLGRKRTGFTTWIGLVRPGAFGVGLALIVALVWLLLKIGLFLIPGFVDIASGGKTVIGAISDNGWSLETALVILLIAGVKTALTEEILFRGIIGKRLVNLMGFSAGNSLQAAFFAAIHLLIFVIPGGPDPTLLLVALVSGVPFAGGWLMGYVNHRDAKGSIMPGWIIHAVGNGISYPVLAFLI